MGTCGGPRVAASGCQGHFVAVGNVWECQASDACWSDIDWTDPSIAEMWPEISHLQGRTYQRVFTPDADGDGVSSLSDCDDKDPDYGLSCCGNGAVEAPEAYFPIPNFYYNDNGELGTLYERNGKNTTSVKCKVESGK